MSSTALDEAVRMIRNEPLVAELADELIPLLTPAIRTSKADGPIDPLGSRFGGDALLLPEHGWPTCINEPYLGRDPDAETFTVRYGEAEELPLTFLAQINLAEVPREATPPMPSDGILSFFVNPHVYGGSAEEQEQFRLFYTPGDRLAQLTQREMPRMKNSGVFEVSPLRPFRMQLSTRYFIQTSESIAERVYKWPNKRDLDYYRFCAKVWGGSGSNGMFVRPVASNDSAHEVAANGLDGLSLREARDESPAEYEKVARQIQSDYVVLFNTGSDRDLRLPSSLWHLAFLVRRADLAAGRFDRYWGSASN